MFDGKAFGQEVVSAVKAHMDKTVGPILLRLDAIEKQLSNSPDRDVIERMWGEITGIKSNIDGIDIVNLDFVNQLDAIKDSIKAIPVAKDGHSPSPEEILPLIEDCVSRTTLAMPKPQDGKDGRDGIDGRTPTTEEILPLIKDEVSRVISGIPIPKDGRDGIDGKDGAPGRSVSIEDVLPLVSEAVAMIPVPKDGRDGIDGKDGKDGVNGTNGRSVSIEDILPLVGDAVAMIPVPKDGKDGRDGMDGKDGAPGPSADEVLSMVQEAVSSIPLPKDGRDGIDGKDGRDGKDGAPGPSLEDMIPIVHDAIALIPVPKDGRDGIDGKDGRDGVDGINGKDGCDALDAMIDRDGNLIIAFNNGYLKNVGHVVGRDGAMGQPGLGFEDMTEEVADDGRTIIRRYSRPGTDEVKEFRHKMYVILDQGLWESGKQYQRGDGVTWSRHFWIAKEDTMEEPKGGSSWRLAVKSGRDGKDYRPPEPNDPKPIKLR